MQAAGRYEECVRGCIMLCGTILLQRVKRYGGLPACAAHLTSHDAVLDTLAEDGNGHLMNSEIRRADTIDHAKRTRFYGSMIDSEYLQKGKTYSEKQDVDFKRSV